MTDSKSLPFYDETTSEGSVPTKRMLSWAKNSAIYRLSKRMMTEKQLHDAISKKAKDKFDPITVEQIKALADYAVSFGYDVHALNDEYYAQVTTRTASNSGRSRRHIIQKLNMKGVNKEIAISATEEIDDFTNALIYARKKRFGPYRREEPDEKRKNKEMSALARGGYSFEIARKIYYLSIEDAEEFFQETHPTALD